MIDDLRPVDLDAMRVGGEGPDLPTETSSEGGGAGGIGPKPPEVDPGSQGTEPVPAPAALAGFWRHPAAVAGALLSFVILALTILGPILYPTDPFEMVWVPFSLPFQEGAPLLGTDAIGRDILAGIIQGARATLLVGGFAALFTSVIGVVIGALAGFYGGWLDGILSRVTEFFQVLPPLLFAMVIVAVLPPSLPVIAAAIGVVSWPAVARLTRAEVMRIRSRNYVRAARAAAASDRYLIWRVILPNASPPLIVAATHSIGAAILFESGLSFLGLADPDVMSWGAIIGNGREHIFTAWWIVTFPGFAIFLTVLAVCLIGDGLNDILDPKRRAR